MTKSSILTINGGSSSIKFALYQDGEPLRRGLYGKIDRIGLSGTSLTFDDPAANQRESRKLSASDHSSGAKFPMDWTRVHDSELVTQELLDDLHRVSACDPDHLPSEIELIETFRQRHPKLPQVACFDTAFHRTIPRVAKLLPIPRRYDAKGVQRYGFHGLSYAYLMEELFPGGIGENAPCVRSRICEGLGFLGIEIDQKRNAGSEGVISTDASRATVRVIRTDEDLMIARSVSRILETNTVNKGFKS